MGDGGMGRRNFIGAAAGAMAGIVAVTATGELGLPIAFKDGKTGKAPEPEIGPVEDLMREHGALRRILLIYEEWVRRLGLNQDEQLQTLAESSRIIRSFVEDYHEKLEEDYLFPRFRSKDTHVELVTTLYKQHQAGRRLTDITLDLAAPYKLINLDVRSRLVESLRQFIRMYRPHAAREDTVLFPAFHRMMAGAGYNKLGDVFEKKEDQLFGEKGFEKVISRIETIEEILGIHQLAQFTPPLDFTRSTK